MIKSSREYFILCLSEDRFTSENWNTKLSPRRVSRCRGTGKRQRYFQNGEGEKASFSCTKYFNNILKHNKYKTLPKNILC